jgi:hypothetical protein
MDHRTVAIISLIGICLDVLGGLYLAYDLLGGQHGPLRLLTRMVTYSIVFGVGYGLGFGLFFGIVSGAATGITAAIELHRTALGRGHYSLPWEATFSAIRSAAFAAGLYRVVGLPFAVAFALIITAGQIFAYSRGMRPGLDYEASRRARLTPRQLWGALVRTVGYITAAMACSVWVHHVDHAWTFSLRVGVVTGVVTATGIMINPYIEYFADNLPERRLGVVGIAIVLCGFTMQSFQYWLPILYIPVR